MPKRDYYEVLGLTRGASEQDISAAPTTSDGSQTYEVFSAIMSPIPPKNTKVGLALSDSTKAAWANPNDKPMEDYAKK